MKVLLLVIGNDTEAEARTGFQVRSLYAEEIPIIDFGADHFRTSWTNGQVGVTF